MTGFYAGFICALIVISIVVCFVWVICALKDEKDKTKELEIKLAQMEANRESQSLDIK